MKFIFLLSFFLSSVSFAVKHNRLTPYQENLQECVDAKFDVSKINSNKELYKALNSFYPLASSDTIYREVEFRQKGDIKKLKLEAGRIQIFAVSDDDSLALLTSEKVGEKNLDNDMQHKALTASARVDQLLFQADILDEYTKRREQRSKQVSVLVELSGTQIKSLIISFPAEKKALNCQQKEGQDICSCKS